MKKHLLFLLALCLLGVGSAFAQNDIARGDVAAPTSTVSCSKAIRRVAASGNPYVVSNASIAGKWMGAGATLIFNPAGTTNYKDGYTYEYLPAQCLVVFYNTSKAATECLEVVKLERRSLVLADMRHTKFYTYGERSFFAEDGSDYYEDANGSVYFQAEDGTYYYKSDDEHHFVDLGLPSGTLWATANVGASAPEDNGDCFAWGEVEFKPGRPYDWSTLKYCLDSDGNSFSKYVVNDSYGDIDNKAELAPEDDAASVNWGEGWRMPSEAQVSELLNYCTWTWTTKNGKNGCEVKSKSNNCSIFLPAAGYYDGYYRRYAGTEGLYWSRSLATNWSQGASGLWILDSGVSKSSYGRYRGCSVRAVRKNKF